MTRQVKPQAGIPVSTYYQEAFVSPLSPSRILEQRSNEPTIRRTAWRLDVNTREAIILNIFINVIICIIEFRA